METHIRNNLRLVRTALHRFTPPIDDKMELDELEKKHTTEALKFLDKIVDDLIEQEDFSQLRS